VAIIATIVAIAATPIISPAAIADADDDAGRAIIAPIIWVVVIAGVIGAAIIAAVIGIGIGAAVIKRRAIIAAISAIADGEAAMAVVMTAVIMMAPVAAGPAAVAGPVSAAVAVAGPTAVTAMRAAAAT